MKHLLKIKVLIALLATISLMFLTSQFAWAEWQIQTVEAEVEIGYPRPYIVIDAYDFPHIVYPVYDWLCTASVVKHAWLTENGIWEIDPIAELDKTPPKAIGGSAKWPSIAIDSDGISHISYNGGGTIIYVEWKGKGDWTWQSVKDEEGNIAEGNYTSVVIDAEDHPHIAYSGLNEIVDVKVNKDFNKWESKIVDSGEGLTNQWKYSSITCDSEGSLYIAYCVGKEVKCAKLLGDSNWKPESVYNVNEPPPPAYTSLACDLNNSPHIIFWCKDKDEKYGKVRLKYAKLKGSGWEIENVKDANNKVVEGGKYTSIAVDLSGDIHITYISKDNEVTYARLANSDKWDIQIIEDQNGVVAKGLYCSMAVDSKGNPHITYYDNENMSLMYAKWVPPEEVLPEIVLLFDTSGSMNLAPAGKWGEEIPEEDTRLYKVKQAAKAFLDILNDFGSKKAKFGIAVFPQLPEKICNGEVITEMTLIDDSTKKQAKEDIGNLVADWGTPLLQGVETAIEMFSGAPAKRVINLLSDGCHNCPTADATVVFSKASDLCKDLGKKFIRVNAIGIGKGVEVNHWLLSGLSKATGGIYMDITDVVDLQTFLYDGYLKILKNQLGLDAPDDPQGLIEAGHTDTYQVKINEYDQRVCFFLGWSTPQKDRLGFALQSPDGTIINTPTHEGDTYKIYFLNLDEDSFKQIKKVGFWSVTIDATGLPIGEQEYYQYTVLVDSKLKMHPGFDQKSYGTGDIIKLTLSLTKAGEPITGLENVNVAVYRPSDGRGNWFAKNKITENQLMRVRVPKVMLGEKLSPLLRKVIALKDIPSPRLVDAGTLKLYDDGTHGDIAPNDGIYTNQFTDTKVEGTYVFQFRAEGSVSSDFEREDMAQQYLTVNVSPKHILVDVEPLPVVERGLKQFKITITPKDAMGNHLGPGYEGVIRLTSSHGRFIGPLQDPLVEGRYNQIIQLPEIVDIKNVDITVNVNGVESSFNLWTELNPPFSAIFHLGSTIPIENFSNNYDSGYSLLLGLDYHFTPQFSLVGLLGYNHFKGGVSSVSDTYWWNVSGNLNYGLSTGHIRLYLNGGLGIYIPRNGFTRFGSNLGVGLDYILNSNWLIGLGGDYHCIFTNGGDTKFIVPHLGLTYRF